jgi:hypothetical protein
MFEESFIQFQQEAAEEQKVTDLKKKSEMAAAAVKATILSEAVTSTKPVELSPEIIDAVQTMSVETLMKEATGTLRKATVTSNGDVKEELVDRAPVLIDKAEVMQVISTWQFCRQIFICCRLCLFHFSLSLSVLGSNIRSC